MIESVSDVLYRLIRGMTMSLEMIQMSEFRHDLAAFLSESTLRLILAGILGGAIGLERELSHKPAGLRTNMFICFGAAMYTLLSFSFSEGSTDRSRITAQIIPGIGFIGAGSILHAKGSVSGLTTAATLFVVASIGMAVGGGAYLLAIFATMVVLVALFFLGRMERRFSFKAELMSYEVTAKDPEKLFVEVNAVLEELHLIMKTVEINQGDGHHRVHFTVEAKHKDHSTLASRLRKCADLERVQHIETIENE